MNNNEQKWTKMKKNEQKWIIQISGSQPGVRVPLGVREKLEGVHKMFNSLIIFGLGVREYQKVENPWYRSLTSIPCQATTRTKRTKQTEETSNGKFVCGWTWNYLKCK